MRVRVVGKMKHIVQVKLFRQRPASGKPLVSTLSSLSWLIFRGTLAVTIRLVLGMVPWGAKSEHEGGY